MAGHDAPDYFAATIRNRNMPASLIRGAKVYLCHGNPKDYVGSLLPLTVLEVLPNQDNPDEPSVWVKCVNGYGRIQLFNVMELTFDGFLAAL